MKLFLDMDGVLADFDNTAERILQTDNIYKYEFIYGAKALWEKLHSDPNLFASFDSMPDAWFLWTKTAHLNPTILTALPRSGAERVDAQKRQWIAKRFGTDVPVITCRTEEKPDYASPGAILIDDRAVNQKKWEAKGGHFILHKSALRSVNALKELGAI